ncbi:MAG: hypothetical protein M3011_11825 [Actinomycetota bacterium]|nr:hypothetical protein [Actinomycetota bacterium]
MEPPVEGPEGTADPKRRDTANGVAATGVAAAFALGLRQVFDPQPVDTVGIEQEAPTKPVDPDKLELRFDPLSSSNTVVVVRRPDGP